jgi:hypothetical protein
MILCLERPRIVRTGLTPQVNYMLTIESKEREQICSVLQHEHSKCANG